MKTPKKELVMMRNKSDTYTSIYSKYRTTQDERISKLSNEVRELKQLVEFLCKKVFE